MTKLKIIITVLVVLLAATMFYFQDDLLNFYNIAAKNLQNFQQKELGDIISEFKKEVCAPEPLNVGGKDAQSFLLKSRVIAETNVQRYENGMMLPLIENAKLNAA